MGSSKAQAKRRGSFYGEHISLELLLKWQEMLHKINPYVRDFKYYMEIDKPQIPNLEIRIHESKKPGVHPGRLNKPTYNEIAVVMTGDEGNPRDIRLTTREDKLVRINELHRSYDPLQYPVFLPHGEDGFHFNIRKYNQAKKQFSDNPKDKVSSKDFYLVDFSIDCKFGEIHSHTD